MLILEDIYLGDVHPSERSFKRNSQYGKALDEVVRAGDALTDTLTEKQKELFEDYMTTQREVNVLTDCETLIYTFRLAAKIMIGVLTEGYVREIKMTGVGSFAHPRMSYAFSTAFSISSR